MTGTFIPFNLKNFVARPHQLTELGPEKSDSIPITFRASKATRQDTIGLAVLTCHHNTYHKRELRHQVKTVDTTVLTKLVRLVGRPHQLTELRREKSDSIPITFRASKATRQDTIVLAVCSLDSFAINEQCRVNPRIRIRSCRFGRCLRLWHHVHEGLRQHPYHAIDEQIS